MAYDASFSLIPGTRGFGGGRDAQETMDSQGDLLIDAFGLATAARTRRGRSCSGKSHECLRRACMLPLRGNVQSVVPRRISEPLGGNRRAVPSIRRHS